MDDSQISVVDNPVIISAKDTWCKTGDLKKFVHLGRTKLSELVTEMQESGEYDDAIIEFDSGMRLVNVDQFIDSVRKRYSRAARKKAMRKGARL